MLSKRKRLGSAGVQKVLAGGKGRSSGVLSVKMLAGKEPLRIAVVVSKKVAKMAVVRNKVRRAAYRALASAELPPTGDAILFVQSIPSGNLSAAFLPDIKKLFHNRVNE